MAGVRRYALPHITDVRSVKFLFLPAEHDPDSYVRELGAEAFERCIAEAIPLSRQLMDAAAEGCDLASAEGRARLLSHAKPLWAALPSGLLKRQLLGDLARRAQLPDQELMTLWQATGAAASPAKEASSPHHDPRDPGYNPQQDGGHSSSSEGDGSGSSGPGTRSGGERKQWKEWKGRDWKGRKNAEDDGPRTPRSQPAAPADHALRMLLLSSAWWEQLSADDHQLLHELPGAHGELVAWLERFLVNHGAGPWSVLEAALAEDGLLDTAQRLSGGLYAEDEPVFEVFQNALKQLRIARLKTQAQVLAASNPVGEGMERFKQLRTQLVALEQELAAALKAAGLAA